MYQWDCTYCGESIRASTSDEVKSKGCSHLGGNHRQELAALFQEKSAGDDCQGGCGEWLPADGDFSGFSCPNCGHDHFNYFAGKHVFWGIEEVEK